jgi:hypothetical protein
VKPAPIVEDLDVLEYGAAHLVDVVPRAAVNQLELERGKERLGDRVVPAVAFAAHADRNVERV